MRIMRLLRDIPCGVNVIATDDVASRFNRRCSASSASPCAKDGPLSVAPVAARPCECDDDAACLLARLRKVQPRTFRLGGCDTEGRRMNRRLAYHFTHIDNLEAGRVPHARVSRVGGQRANRYRSPLAHRPAPPIQTAPLVARLNLGRPAPRRPEPPPQSDVAQSLRLRCSQLHYRPAAATPSACRTSRIA